MPLHPALRFFLGTDRPHWLGLTEVPLFVSRRTLVTRKKLPRALGPWALDSGGFTELSMHGQWTVTAKEYAAQVERIASEVGKMVWCAPCDWMCEPQIIAKTGLTVPEHQKRSVASFLELRAIGFGESGARVIPVVQGWTLGDYRDCLELYERAGVDLRAEQTVGVGSVCRRQNTNAASSIMHAIAEVTGPNLHGFGFKRGGLGPSASTMVSADSLAWSYRARRAEGRLNGCTRAHMKCSSCLDWALCWYRETLLRIRPCGLQLGLKGV